VLRTKLSTYIVRCDVYLKESVMRDMKEHVDGGNELGQELKNEVEKKAPVPQILFKEPSPPLFMSDGSEGKKGNLQDEKDETEE
jgi:hypothetical protein